MSDMTQPFAGGHSSGFGAEQTNATGHTEDQYTAGMLLRHVRESSGLHIGALAVLLKVPVRKLEALEADRFDLLPDLVFARALALSVCRNLKVDPTPILERFPESAKPQLVSRSASINAPFRARGIPRTSGWANASRRAIIAGLVLVAGAAVLVMFPAIESGVEAIRILATTYSSDDNKSAPQEASLANADPATVGAKSTATDSGDSAVAPATLVGATSLSTQSNLLASGTSPGGDANVSSASSQPGAALAPDTASGTTQGTAASDAQNIVSFAAKEESWVKVTDATGRAVLNKTLKAGEVAGVTGDLPLSATVGRADATSVEVRGKPLQLDLYTKNNVARFEVK